MSGFFPEGVAVRWAFGAFSVRVELPPGNFALIGLRIYQTPFIKLLRIPPGRPCVRAGFGVTCAVA
jgi:hypothetical protein